MHFCRGEKATAESIADAIAENRAELVHHPSTLDLHLPFPSKECPSCDGSVSTKTVNVFRQVSTEVCYFPLT